MTMDEMITITKREYDELIERDAWLYYLESVGVDNWEGISYAYELRREDREGNEDEDEED